MTVEVWDDEYPLPRTGIVLACGHVWVGDGTLAEAREFAALCVATGDTAPCDTCGSQQAVTREVVELTKGEPS